MKITEFKKLLMPGGNLDNFYIFVGDEIGIMNIYLEQMSKVTKMPIIREESVSSALLKSQSGTLFGSEGGIFVVREDSEFVKTETAFDRVADIKNNYIILIMEKIDTRTKFAKHFKDRTVEFEKLSEAVLSGYIKKQCDLNGEEIKELIECSGGNYDVSMLECDKIKTYAEACHISHSKALKKLLDRGTIHKVNNYNVFSLTDAVCSMRVINAYTILEKLIAEEISSINILGTLYKSLKAVMLIQVCESKDIANTTGLENGQIYYNRKYVGNFDVQDLLVYLDLIQNTVDEIKRGKIDDEIATAYVLNIIFGGGKFNEKKKRV